MADSNAARELLYGGISPGPVDLAEFDDWYDNEHIPVRAAMPGFYTAARYLATDGLKPESVALYEIEPGTLRTPEYRALRDTASERERRIFAGVASVERRVYSLVSDSGNQPGYSGAAPVLMTVSMSVPPEVEPEVDAYYAQEHFPLLLAVPGWRRARRYVLTSGDAPRYLSVHEVDSAAAFDEPGYKAATSTPWRNRIVGSATSREKRVFGLHRAW